MESGDKLKIGYWKIKDSEEVSHLSVRWKNSLRNDILSLFLVCFLMKWPQIGDEVEYWIGHFEYWEINSILKN